MKITFNAQLLTVLLGVGLIALIAAIGCGFYLSQKQLRSYAQETSRLTAEADMKQQNINNLQKLKKDLEELKPVQEKARQISADSTFYQYQNEIVRDITKIAVASNITITSYTFSETGAATTGAATGGAAATAAPAPAATTPSPTPPTTSGAGAPTGQNSATPAPAAASQLKSKTVTITFKTPLKYEQLLNFVHLIEQNPTKMQIATLNISRGEKPDEVTTQSFQLEVYVK